MFKNLKVIISIVLISIAIGITIWCFILKKQYQAERLNQEDFLFRERVVVEKLQERLTRAKKEIGGLSKSIANLMQKSVSLESEVFSHRRELDLAKNKLAQLGNHNISVSNKIEQADANINNIKNRIEYFTKEAVKVEERLTLLLKTKDALAQQLEQYAKVPSRPVMPARYEHDIYQDSYRPMQKEELREADFLTGEVLTVNREFAFIVINLGKSSGIEEGMVLTVLRDNRNLARVKVETVREYISVAYFIDKETIPLIKTGDRVRAIHGD